MSKTELNLDIQNNTGAVISMNMMGGFIYKNDISNQRNGYVYDVTSLVFGVENMVTLEYKPAGAAAFLQYSASLQEQSVAGVVQALNGLGIGSFFTYTSGLNTYIANYSNDYEFGVLNIFNPGYIPFNYAVNLLAYNPLTTVTILVNALPLVVMTGGNNYNSVLNNAIQNGDNVGVQFNIQAGDPLTNYLIYYEPNIPSPPTIIVSSGSIVAPNNITDTNQFFSGRTYYLQV